MVTQYYLQTTPAERLKLHRGRLDAVWWNGVRGLKGVPAMLGKKTGNST